MPEGKTYIRRARLTSPVVLSASLSPVARCRASLPGRDACSAPQWPAAPPRPSWAAAGRTRATIFADDQGIVGRDGLGRRVARHEPDVAVDPLQRLHRGFAAGGPLNLAATISPFSAVSCFRITIRSPSTIAAPVIESPLTRSMNSCP